MASSDTISIDTSALQNGLQQFDSRKAVFEKTAYSTYKGSYLKTSGSSTVAKLRAKVDGLYSDLSSSYSGISSYTKAYLESMLNLEASLKSGKLSKADEANVTERIMLLNAILNGGDPSEIEINPRTGMVTEGIFDEKTGYNSLNMKEFEKANAAKKITYVDHDGKKVTIDGYTANEMNMLITAAMTSGSNYRMVANSSKSLRKKNAAILTSEYARAPIAIGFADGFNDIFDNGKISSDKISVSKLSKEQKKTIEHYKGSWFYKGGYYAGVATRFIIGGALLSESKEASRFVKKLDNIRTTITRPWHKVWDVLKVPNKVWNKVGGAYNKVECLVANKAGSAVRNKTTKKVFGTTYKVGKKFVKSSRKRVEKNLGRNIENSAVETYNSDGDAKDFATSVGKKSAFSAVFGRNRVTKNVGKSSVNLEKGVESETRSNVASVDSALKVFKKVPNTQIDFVSDIRKEVDNISKSK